MFDFFKREKTNLNICAPVSGFFFKMEEVPDPVFADKIMGDGFAIKPDDKVIFSPICGEVRNIFPTKHAIMIEDGEGNGVIVHMGIDTVELGGKPFTTHVKEGQKVTQKTKIATVNLKMLKEQGKEDYIIIAFPKLKNPDIHFSIEKQHVEKQEIIAQLN